MGYKEALEEAGAKVLAFEHFGSYQGDWYAKVEFNGKTGWVHGSFGSCSHCDAFESEFGVNWPITKESLAKFGLEYLDNILDQESAEKEASKYTSWDVEANDMLKFIKENA